jgi:hypothetical protein
VAVSTSVKFTERVSILEDGYTINRQDQPGDTEDDSMATIYFSFRGIKSSPFSYFLLAPRAQQWQGK